MRRMILNLALAAIAVFSAAGCLNSEEPEAIGARLDSTNQGKAAFEAGLELWKQNRPPAYSFQLSRNCFCFPYGRMEVFVDGDQVVKVDTIQGVEGPYDLASLKNAPSMDGIFDQVEGYLNNPEYQVKASYNERMGYPTSVLVHHVLNYEDADAEFLIASFRPDK